MSQDKQNPNRPRSATIVLGAFVTSSVIIWGGCNIHTRMTRDTDTMVENTYEKEEVNNNEN